MPSPSVTYTFTNGTTSDATQVNQNFTDLVNAMTDGTKDFSIANLTASGTLTFSGLTASRLTSTNASKQLASNAALVANGFAYPDGTGSLASTAATTNGQLLIGATAGAPTAGTLTGTANQITVTNAANSITLSLPQNIDTAATPQFGGVGIGIAAAAGVLKISSATAAMITLAPTVATNAFYTTLNNDASHRAIIGKDNSAGNSLLVSGGSAYALTLATIDAQSLIFATSNNQRMEITSAGAVTIAGTTTATGGVTFGNSSPTNLNAYQEGTFTATITGCTTSPTVTARYVLVGKKVTVIIPTLTATSNTTACTITGFPAAIQQATQSIMGIDFVEDNTLSYHGYCFLTAGTLTLGFMNTISTFTQTFTNVGAKGVNGPVTFTYTIQ